MWMRALPGVEDHLLILLTPRLSKRKSHLRSDVADTTSCIGAGVLATTQPITGAEGYK